MDNFDHYITSPSDFGRSDQFLNQLQQQRDAGYEHLAVAGLLDLGFTALFSWLQSRKRSRR